MAFFAQHAAQILNGEMVGRDTVLCPGPHHSDLDRSLSVKFTPGNRDGFICHSFAGDDPLECRDHVKAKLGIVWQPDRPAMPTVVQPAPETTDDADRQRKIDYALALWKASTNPRGSCAEVYLNSRHIDLDPDLAGAVLRFHPALKHGPNRVPGMVALYRNALTDKLTGIQQWPLEPDGTRLDKTMLGTIKGSVIKIDCDHEVCWSDTLAIAEGLESALSARMGGLGPIWAVGSAGAVAQFPVIRWPDKLIIVAESDDAGANRKASLQCAERWVRAGKDVQIFTPTIRGDANDVLRELAI